MEQPCLKYNTTAYVCKMNIDNYQNMFHFTYFLILKRLRVYKNEKMEAEDTNVTFITSKLT